MTPKEQADQLFTKHYQPIFEFGEELSEESIVSLLAIKAAQITVNQIIKELKSIEFNYDVDFSSDLIVYWNDVEKELLKL